MFGWGLSSGAGLVLALVSLVQVNAHIALWDEGMYGWDPSNPNQQEPIYPLEKLPFNQWWFHNYINQPPQPGKMMQLPAGGTYHGQVACNRALTTYGQNDYQLTEYACDDNTATSGTGAMHTTDNMGDPNPKDVKGCGLAIAYESDVSKLKPEDFTVISVAYECPWKRNVDFHIPADLPACPEGGCHCSWGWVHSKDAGSPQMYHLGYRCDVTGAVATRPLPAPLVSRKCDYPNDVSNCTVGGKQPHYWLQAEGNNNFQGEHDPPYYNQEMGFMNGAQTDLYAAAGDAPAPEAPSSAPPAAPAPSSAAGPGQSSSSPEVSSTISASAVPSASAVSEEPPQSSAASAISSQLSAVASSVMTNVNAVNSASTSAANSIPSSSAPSATSSTATSATVPTAASGKTCRRKKRRSLGTDAHRHQARAKAADRHRNRTIGVRHTTALPRA